MKNFYPVLGLELGASDAEIKKAYRRLALQHHPDKNIGSASATVKFQMVCHSFSLTRIYSIILSPFII